MNLIGEQDVPCISNEAATTQYQPDSASVSHWNTITPHPSWIEEKKALSDQIQMLCASQNLGLVALLRSEIEVLKLQLMEMTKIRDSFADNLKEMEAQIELLMKERGILLAQLETSNKNLLYYRWLYVSAAIEQASSVGNPPNQGVPTMFEKSQEGEEETIAATTIGPTSELASMSPLDEENDIEAELEYEASRHSADKGERKTSTLLISQPEGATAEEDTVVQDIPAEDTDMLQDDGPASPSADSTREANVPDLSYWTPFVEILSVKIYEEHEDSVTCRLCSHKNHEMRISSEDPAIFPLSYEEPGLLIRHCQDAHYLVYQKIETMLLGANEDQSN